MEISNVVMVGCDLNFDIKASSPVTAIIVAVIVALGILLLLTAESLVVKVTKGVEAIAKVPGGPALLIGGGIAVAAVAAIAAHSYFKRRGR